MIGELTWEGPGPLGAAQERDMAELWGFIDNAPVAYIAIIGLVAIGISYILDVFADGWEGWK